jgi:hypothetical protein
MVSFSLVVNLARIASRFIVQGSKSSAFSYEDKAQNQSWCCSYIVGIDADSSGCRLDGRLDTVEGKLTHVIRKKKHETPILARGDRSHRRQNRLPTSPGEGRRRLRFSVWACLHPQAAPVRLPPV